MCKLDMLKSSDLESVYLEIGHNYFPHYDVKCTETCMYNYKRNNLICGHVGSDLNRNTGLNLKLH